MRVRTCSVSSPTQRDVLKEGMIAGFSFVPFGPMIGSRLQKMSGVFMISFFSMPVDMSSLSTMTPEGSGLQKDRAAPAIAGRSCDVGRTSRASMFAER